MDASREEIERKERWSPKEEKEWQKVEREKAEKVDSMKERDGLNEREGLIAEGDGL